MSVIFTSSPKHQELRLWVTTQIIDYACCVAAASIGWLLHGNNVHDGDVNFSINLLLKMSLSALLSIGLIYLRETIHFTMLGDEVPEAKRHNLSLEDKLYIVPTTIVAIASFSFMEYHGWTYTDTNRFGENKSLLQFIVTEVYMPFFTLLVLRDVFFLWPFHQLMHTPYFYHLHKTHHQAATNAQGMHSFRIGMIDFLIENAGAPVLLLAFQYATGNPVGFHLLVPYLLSFHDGALHSVNPYSAMYFIPLLDYIFKPTIYHQLHHAVPHKGYMLFIPYHHLIPSKRQKDIDYYNKIFKTSCYSDLFSASSSGLDKSQQALWTPAGKLVVRNQRRATRRSSHLSRIAQN